MDKVIITVQGDRDLYKAFDLIEDKLRKTALRKALQTVGRFWRDAMKARTPVAAEAHRKGVAPGALKRAITYATKIKNVAYGGIGKLWVGPRYDKSKGQQDPGVYGLMVELGTEHSAAKPFARPTFESTHEEATKKFGETLWNEIKPSR